MIKQIFEAIALGIAVFLGLRTQVTAVKLSQSVARPTRLQNRT